MDWDMLKPKWIVELLSKNTALSNEINELNTEIEELKNKLSCADVIIREYEERVNKLKAELLTHKYRSLSMEISEGISNNSVKNRNIRGAGRKSKADDETVELIKRLNKEGLSQRKIAEKLTEMSNKQWSKSTVGYILRKNRPV